MKRVYLSPPHMSGDELALVENAFTSNWIAPVGPHVDAFEREFAERVQVPQAVALATGTAALHLALILVGVEAGDKVFCSSLTFVATANAILYQRGEPVFIDSEPATWNMDPELLREELRCAARDGKLPRAVVVVDLYGQSADHHRLLTVCDEYGVPVIEDAAEALGATYKGQPVGSFGRFGVFSFNGNKIITTSMGGMLVSMDRAAVERARYLSSQARLPAPHYEHAEMGFNYRMSNILAAVGRGQLRLLDERVAARRRIFRRYHELLGDLPGLAFMPEPKGMRSTRWLTCLTLQPALFGATREEVRKALENENIEARPVWKPMHQQPLFRHCKVRGGGVSDELFDTGLCLPSGSSLSDADLERIADIIRCQCPNAGGRREQGPSARN